MENRVIVLHFFACSSYLSQRLKTLFVGAGHILYTSSAEWLTSSPLLPSPTSTIPSPSPHLPHPPAPENKRKRTDHLSKGNVCANQRDIRLEFPASQKDNPVGSFVKLKPALAANERSS